MGFHQMCDVLKEKDEECYVGSLSGKKRQRFYLELTPGETTIVSWKKLLRDGKEIDDGDATNSTGTHTFSTLKNQGDTRLAGQCDILRDKKLRAKSGAGSSGRNARVASANIKAEMNNALVGNLWEYYGEAKAKSKFPRHSFSSDVAKDHIPGRLRDSPLLSYSKNSTLFSKQSCYLPVRVVEDASMFPVKTNHGNLRKSCKKNIINMEAGNASSNVLSENLASRSVPLLTYHRSRDTMKDKQAKVGRVVLDDNSIHQTVKTNTNKIANPVPCLKRKVGESGARQVHAPSPYVNQSVKKAAVDHRGFQAKTPHPHAKTVRFTLSSERNLTATAPQTHIKALNMDAAGKSNVKIRFHLNQEPETVVREQQVAKNAVNH